MNIDLILFFILFLCSKQTPTDLEILSICPPVGPKLTLLNSNRIVDKNLQELFNKGSFLGKGSFGSVIRVDLQEYDVREVAVKKMEFYDSDPNKNELNKSLALNELKTLKKMSSLNSQVVPNLFACQVLAMNYSGNIIVHELYIVQTLMGKDLDDPESKEKLRTMSTNNKLKEMIKILVALRTLWQNGIAHRDVKENNVMWDLNGNLRMIDLNLSEEINQQTTTEKKKKSLRGTPGYISPGCYLNPNEDLEERDDLYSFGITAIGMLCPTCQKVLYEDFVEQNIKYGHCHSQPMSLECRNHLLKKAHQILQNLGFGTYESNPQNHKKETTNFTTVIINILFYNRYRLNFSEIIETLQYLADNVYTRDVLPPRQISEIDFSGILSQLNPSGKEYLNYQQSIYRNQNQIPIRTNINVNPGNQIVSVQQQQFINGAFGNRIRTVNNYQKILTPVYVINSGREINPNMNQYVNKAKHPIYSVGFRVI